MDFVGLFNTISPADIAEFIGQSQEENLHLEFKTLANADMRAADDRRNLARALSGFANSSGGLIIWGVEARKNAQGIDCARASAEIAPVRQLIPYPIDQNLYAQSRSPMDMIRHGWSTSLFQASQQWSTRLS
jgi:Schlafen, AlbA_2